MNNKAFEQWWSSNYAGNWKPQALEDCFKEIAKVGWEAALKSIQVKDNLEKDDTVLTREEELESVISLVFDLSEDKIKAFISEATLDELNEAESWCVEAYYKASDNSVRLLPMPACLQELRDAEGDYNV